MHSKILMPALSPTMEKGKIVKWYVREGDDIQPGDIIADIETDKAVMEVEAVDIGKIEKILVTAGSDNVAVNTPIAVIDTEDENGAESESATSGDSFVEQDGQNSNATQDTSPSAPAPTPTPLARRLAAKHAIDLKTNSANGSGLIGTGARGRITHQDVERLIADARAQESHSDISTTPSTWKGHAHTQANRTRLFASPLARRLARERGIDPAHVTGTGPNGRIVKRDILGDIHLNKAQQPAFSDAKTQEAKKDTPVAIDPFALFAPESYDLIPHDAMRTIIAERLTLSKQTIPHYYLNSRCLLDRLIAVRKDVNQAGESAQKEGHHKVSVNDFIIKALAHALVAVPEANVIWSDTGMLRLKQTDIGVAVAVEGGLFTPVIRNASDKALSVIAAEMKDFAARARTRRLRPEEYQGGATSISNLGMYGIRSFSAVINPPQSTILAVGRGEPRPHINEEGELVKKTVMDITLSCDHRSIDGALGARLLEAFRHFIENPDTLTQ